MKLFVELAVAEMQVSPRMVQFVTQTPPPTLTAVPLLAIWIPVFPLEINSQFSITKFRFQSLPVPLVCVIVSVLLPGEKILQFEILQLSGTPKPAVTRIGTLGEVPAIHEITQFVTTMLVLVSVAGLQQLHFRH